MDQQALSESIMNQAFDAYMCPEDGKLYIRKLLV